MLFCVGFGGKFWVRVDGMPEKCNWGANFGGVITVSSKRGRGRPKAVVVEGDGTAERPFPEATRQILQALIDNPRANAATIKEICKRKGLEEWRHIQTKHIDQAPLSELINHRVDLVPKRYGKSGATTLIYVELIENSQDMQVAFEEDLNQVSGVIEWDLTSQGSYIVRVAGRMSGIASEIIETIKSIDWVDDAFEHVHVMRSGVVDNISPDQFFFFQQKKK